MVNACAYTNVIGFHTYIHQRDAVVFIVVGDKGNKIIDENLFGDQNSLVPIQRLFKMLAANYDMGQINRWSWCVSIVLFTRQTPHYETMRLTDSTSPSM